MMGVGRRKSLQCICMSMVGRQQVLMYTALVSAVDATLGGSWARVPAACRGQLGTVFWRLYTNTLTANATFTQSTGSSSASHTTRIVMGHGDINTCPPYFNTLPRMYPSENYRVHGPTSMRASV